MIVALIVLRLQYSQKEFEKLAEIAKDRIKEPDEKLTAELRKRNPDKLSVISLVSQILGIRPIIKEIEESSSAVNKQIYLDFLAIATLVVTGVILSIPNVISVYLTIVITITAVVVILTVLSFITQIQDIQSYKKKLNENQD